jgi:hypothetical protein
MYAWTLVLIGFVYVVGVLTAAVQQEFISTDDLLSGTVSIGIMVLAIIGVFGFAYQRAVLHKALWRVFFVVILVWQVGYPITSMFTVPVSLTGLHIPLNVTIAILLLPQYVALFLYAWTHQSYWGKDPTRRT